MKCPFCTKIEKKDVFIKEVIVKDTDVHLLVTRNGESNAWHVHGPVSNKPQITKIIQVIAEEAGLELETD
jgi:hypothetical protein